MWDIILGRLNKTRLTLQSSSIDINNAVSLLSSLMEFVDSLRFKFDEFEAVGKRLSGNYRYKKDTTRRQRRKQQVNDGHGEEVELSGKDEFRCHVFIPVLDMLKSEFTKRTAAYSDVCCKFGFLSKIGTMDSQWLRNHCSRLLECYPDDLESNWCDEVVQFASYAGTHLPHFTHVSKNNNFSSELNLYLMLVRHGLRDVFLNLDVLLRIYLCLMVMNCTGECSFSKLKLIKDEVRATMKQGLLDMLSLM